MLRIDFLSASHFYSQLNEAHFQFRFFQNNCFHSKYIGRHSTGARSTTDINNLKRFVCREKLKQRFIKFNLFLTLVGCFAVPLDELSFMRCVKRLVAVTFLFVRLTTNGDTEFDRYIYLPIIFVLPHVVPIFANITSSECFSSVLKSQIETVLLTFNLSSII